MLEHAEKAGEPHALAVSIQTVAPSAAHSLAFLIAVDVIALNAVSKELPGVAPDPLLDILVLTARRFRDRELGRTGG